MWQYNYQGPNNELYHYGKIGMRWGHRKNIYEVSDRNQKRLAKDIKKIYKKSGSLHSLDAERASDKKVENILSTRITKTDKENLGNALAKYKKTAKELDKVEKQVDDFALKYAKKKYDSELLKNPKTYDTPRAQDKLFSYFLYDEGYSAAYKKIPNFEKKQKESDDAWASYTKERTKVTDKLLGAYGNQPLYTLSLYNDKLVKDKVQYNMPK